MAEDTGDTTYGPGGRGFYGAVTVSERGQIVIPAQARRDLNIRPGDKLLVLGDPAQGLALATIDRLIRNWQGPAAVLEQITEHARDPRPEEEPER